MTPDDILRMAREAAMDEIEKLRADLVLAGWRIVGAKSKKAPPPEGSGARGLSPGDMRRSSC